MTKYNYLLEDLTQCRHESTWQSECDCIKSLYNCCKCGKQFTEEEYKKLTKERRDGK